MVKTTGNRNYGHSRIGHRALVQLYASNAACTINLLHNMHGVGHVNLLPGPSNGLELLHFFREALQEEDIFGNLLLKVGDTVILDNCGFHHARRGTGVKKYAGSPRNCLDLSTLPSPI